MHVLNIRVIFNLYDLYSIILWHKVIQFRKLHNLTGFLFFFWLTARLNYSRTII